MEGRSQPGGSPIRRTAPGSAPRPNRPQGAGARQRAAGQGMGRSRSGYRMCMRLVLQAEALAAVAIGHEKPGRAEIQSLSIRWSSAGLTRHASCKRGEGFGPWPRIRLMPAAQACGDRSGRRLRGPRLDRGLSDHHRQHRSPCVFGCAAGNTQRNGLKQRVA